MTVFGLAVAAFIWFRLPTQLGVIAKFRFKYQADLKELSSILSEIIGKP